MATAGTCPLGERSENEQGPELCGVGFAAIYPVVVVIAGQYYRDDQGLAIGAIATGGGLGSFLFPFAMSALAQGLGIGQAFWFYVVLSLAMSMTAVLVIWRKHSAQV